MIKSKIDARERALELATSFCKGVTMSDEIVTRCANNFTLFLIGDAQLPETEPGVEDITNNAIERILSVYGLNFGNANALDGKPSAEFIPTGNGFPIGGIVPGSEQQSEQNQLKIKQKE